MRSTVSTAHQSQARAAARGRWLPGCVIGLWLFVALVWMARLSVLIELASHFVFHAVLAGAVVLILCAVRRRPGWFFLAAVPWLYCVWLLEPWSLWLEEPQVASERTLRIVSWNLLCTNKNIDEIKAIVSEHAADLLILIEVRPSLMQQIPELQQKYRHWLAFPAWGGGGIAVLTDRDDIELERIDFGDGRMPSIIAKVTGYESPSRAATLGTGELKIVGMHTWSPIPPRRTGARDEQLAALTAWAKQQAGPLCVVGDLNVTPWAPAFSRLQQAGFFDSRRSGFGNSATWPSWLGPLGIPIDHALSYGQCHVISRQVGPMVSGSDHRPLIIEVSY